MVVLKFKTKQNKKHTHTKKTQKMRMIAFQIGH